MANPNGGQLRWDWSGFSTHVGRPATQSSLSSFHSATVPFFPLNMCWSRWPSLYLLGSPNTTIMIIIIIVVVHRDVDFCKLSDKIKLILHGAGIHATTIQPEYVHLGTVFEVRRLGLHPKLRKHFV